MEEEAIDHDVIYLWTEYIFLKSIPFTFIARHHKCDSRSILFLLQSCKWIKSCWKLTSHLVFQTTFLGEKIARPRKIVLAESERLARFFPHSPTSSMLHLHSISTASIFSPSFHMCLSFTQTSKHEGANVWNNYFAILTFIISPLHESIPQPSTRQLLASIFKLPHLYDLCSSPILWTPMCVGSLTYLLEYWRCKFFLLTTGWKKSNSSF